MLNAPAEPEDRQRGRRRTALVTGANRGIGLAVARALAVRDHDLWLAVRDPGRGQAAAQWLRSRYDVNVRVCRLELDDSVAVRETVASLRQLPVDVLINNAGIYPGSTFLETDAETFAQALQVNCLGPLRLMQALLPGMVARGWGRIVNVSSGSGSHDEGLPGPAAYSVSKAALNALTAKAAQGLPGTVKINAACPGWVRTSMGGDQAPLTPEQGAETIVWLATLANDGPSGGLFRFRERLAW